MGLKTRVAVYTFITFVALVALFWSSDKQISTGDLVGMIFITSLSAGLWYWVERIKDER